MSDGVFIQKAIFINLVDEYLNLLETIKLKQK